MSRIGRDGYIETQDGPLCPYAGAPGMNDAHRLQVKLIDLAYEASAKDEDGEIADPDVAKVNHAMTYGPGAGDRMNLYRTSTVTRGPGAVAVEALWFHCPICDFILPARESAPW